MNRAIISVLLITGIVVSFSNVFAQENQIITGVPFLEIFDVQLNDQNQNGVLESGESGELTFRLQNSGGMDAKSLKIRLSLKDPKNVDIKFRKNRSLYLLKSKTDQQINFPLEAGDSLGTGSAFFIIVIEEINGFGTRPLTFNFKTDRKPLDQNLAFGEKLPESETGNGSSNFVLSPATFEDQNLNSVLEAFESSRLKIRVFNKTNNKLEGVSLFIRPEKGNPSGINYTRGKALRPFTPLGFQDVSIDILGKKSLEDGVARFSIYVIEENGSKSQEQVTEIQTRSYEVPELWISKIRFVPEDGDQIDLDEDFVLMVEITNKAGGTAYEIDLTPRLTTEKISFIGNQSDGWIKQLPGGESSELELRFHVPANYAFPNIPMILEVTEEFNDLYLDSLIYASVNLMGNESLTAENPASEVATEEVVKEIPKVSVSNAAKNTVPMLVVDEHQFIDADENKVINFSESCFIRFKVRNEGNGTAENVTVQVKQLNQDIVGLNFPDSLTLGSLKPQQETEVDIPIRSGTNLPSGQADFKIEVMESLGFDARPLLFTIETARLLEPSLSILQTEFTGENGQVARNVPLQLKLTLVNQGEGDANDILVQFELPEPYCFLLGEARDTFTVRKLPMGSTRDFTIPFITNRRYTDKEIPIRVEISESLNRFGIDTTLTGFLVDNASDVTRLSIQPRVNDPEVKPESEIIAELPPEKESDDPLEVFGFDETIEEFEFGQYYALIIGIDEYSGIWPTLENAVNDARAVKELLESKYKFDVVRTLYNGMASRKNILWDLDWLLNNVSENDNLLIYYSGHGMYRENLNKGYWVPSGATTRFTHEFISNSEIQTFLASIKSKHTLLISDACFSGDIFNTRGETSSIQFRNNIRYYQDVHHLNSRKAITSGGMEPVWDGGADGHSIFTYNLLRFLESNENRLYDASQLYNDLRIPVINNSQQEPVFRPIQNTGDEGGQFIFIRK